MDRSREFSAYDVVNGYSQEELEGIFLKYGEERAFKKIAKLIVDERKNNGPIESAAELSALIEKYHRTPNIHPATRVFQAIRIEVNDELGELERFFDVLERNAKKGMIVAVITFHSLEDRIVKTRFKEWSRRCICPPEAFRCECGNNNELGKPVNKKPLTASKPELKVNPRSRSAKLRAFMFTKDGNGREI
jgi:16S rRNA (cytosine1402-N4)-methyltransferase